MVDTIQVQASKLRDTYALVAFGLITAILTGVFAFPFVESISNGWVIMGLFVLEILAIIAIVMTKNIFTYLTFTSISGITFVPIISHFITNGQTDIIFQAAFGTAFIFVSLSVYAMTTKKNFLSWQGVMFWILIGLIAVGILNIFIGSTFLQFLFSAVAVAVFSIYIVIDTQRVLLEGEHPVYAATSLYLNIINIFVNLLSLLSLSGNDD